MLNFELFWDFKQRKTRGDLTWIDGIGLLGGRRMEIREDFMGKVVIWPGIWRKSTMVDEESHIV